MPHSTTVALTVLDAGYDLTSPDPAVGLNLLVTPKFFLCF